MFLFAYITISEISISKFRNFKMWNFNILNFRIQTCHCFVVLIKITFAFSKLHGPTSILKYQKTYSCDKNNFIWTIWGTSSSRKLHYVIYYTLYRMDPQKTRYKNSFSSKCQNQTFGKSVYIFLLTPDQPPLQGGYLC